MNLTKIFDLVKCSRNSIPCNADILTIEDAKEIVEEWQPYCYIPLLIVNLWKNEENTMKICDVVRLCKTYGENTTLAELQKRNTGK